MNPEPHIIGRIVTAPNMEEAVKLFRLRKTFGIGGVIFTPDIRLPDWDDADKDLLTENDVTVDPFNYKIASASNMSEDWMKAAGDVPAQLVETISRFHLAKAFQRVIFLMNDHLNEPAHFDKIADKGALHLHISGEGLRCLTPVNANPVYIKISYAETAVPDDVQKFKTEGVLRSIDLQPDQAIMFDETVLHESGKGKRFRMLTLE